MWEQITHIVPQEEETAHSVPAAAALQRSKDMFGTTTHKDTLGHTGSRVGKARAQPTDVRLY